MSNNLQDTYQSAYRVYHSKETALLKVHHDIVTALYSNSCAVLLILDLSAAFDVIDHSILVKRLKFSYGKGGDALAWIESYLTNRHQRVAVLSSTSADFQLNYGVPQVSVLGPKLYCMFSKPIYMWGLSQAWNVFPQLCWWHSSIYGCQTKPGMGHNNT